MENGFMNKIVGLVLVLVIGATLVGGLLIPTLSSAQETAGTPITKSNAEQLNYGEYGQYWDENVTFVLASPTGAATVGDTTITVNGESVSMRSGFNRHIVLTSDNLIIEINTASSVGNAGIVYYSSEDDTKFEYGIPLGNTITAEYNKSAGTIRLTYPAGDIDVTLNATYCFTVSNKQDYAYVNATSEFPRMYMTHDLIEAKLGGVIEVFSTTITIDSTPVLVVLVSDAGGTRVIYDRSTYAGEIKAELVFNGLQLVGGTTDIYTGGAPSFNITADGETVTPDTITPARSFIISKVSGHAASGANYTMLGVIGLLGIVLLVTIAAGAVRGKY